jgi:hypothetical protein
VKDVWADCVTGWAKRLAHLVSKRKGSAEAVYLLGLIPYLLVIMLATLQSSLIGYTLIVTESAAHDGVRAAARSIRDTNDEPVETSSQRAVQLVSQSSGVPMIPTTECPPGEGFVSVTVTSFVPLLFFSSKIALSHPYLFSFTRSVVMPREGNC